jgi:hypothetical protein
MDLFRRTGDEIRRRFLAAELDDEAFPDIVVPVLEEARLHEAVTLESLVDGVLDAERLPPAAVAETFSDAGVCVYHDAHFSIEVLTWLDASTMAHEHGFCGAFQVLAGGSLHTTYRFDAQRRVSEKLTFGRLERSRVERLRPGAIAPILPGNRFIHRLFHLERPSLSLVVRTSVKGALPQYAYLEPGIAYDPFGRSQALAQHVKLLRVLQRLNHPGFVERLCKRIESADLYSAFILAMEFGRGLQGHDDLGGLAPILHERFREQATTVESALEQRRRFDRITALRRRVSDPDQRFFLALLLNAADRSELLDLIAGDRPGQPPEELALGWLGAVAERGGLGELDRTGLEQLATWLRGETLPRGAERSRLDPDAHRSRPPGRTGAAL